MSAVLLPAFPPHQSRVLDEKADLDQKRERLATFIGGDSFKHVPAAERTRMIEQYGVMTRYSNILRERIAAFPIVG